jgi:hypothetical protein
VAALKEELDSFLIAETHRALEAAKELQAQGLPKESAEELAKDDLLVKPPEEDYRPKKWEIEGASADFIAAARKHLLKHKLHRRNRSPKNRPPTTPPISPPASEE